MTNSVYVFAFSACTRSQFQGAMKTENQKNLGELCASRGMVLMHEYKAAIASYEFTPKRAVREFQQVVALHKESVPDSRILFVIDNLLLFRMSLDDKRHRDGDLYRDLEQMGEVVDRLIFEREAEVYFDACAKGGFLSE